MATMNEILDYLNNRENTTNTKETCTFEATIRITNLPNIKDKDLLAKTVYDWLDNNLAFGIEEHMLESELEDAGIELDDFQYLNWEIDNKTRLTVIKSC